MKKYIFSFAVSMLLMFTLFAQQEPPAPPEVPELTSVKLVNAAVRTEVTEYPEASLGKSSLVAAADSTPIEVHVEFSSPSPNQSWGNWLLQNLFALIALVLVIGEIIARKTPTEKDNANLLWLRNLFNFIFGNRKAGGGNF